ncbi:MAG: FAD-binding oxidoreductase, partial [Kutzneria sp.]|nr:FAD-binding oxidoreductase [Kutzneria sp.]
HNLPVAVQATGHGVALPADGALLVSTRRMTEVRVDIMSATALVGAGAQWTQVIDEAARHGLAPLNGSAPFVGAVGYTLGGGIGVLSRRYGYAADHVRRLEVVTPDGTPRTASAEENPDLFWALRGGRANFGIVTAMVIDLLPVTKLYGGGLYFAGELTRDVLHAYRTWAPRVPDEMTTSVALFPYPDEPSIPEPIRGRFTVHVRVAYLGEAGEGAELVRPLRDVGERLLDTVGMMPYSDVGSIHGDIPEPAPTCNQSTHLRELDREAMETLLAFAEPAADPLFAVEIRHLGGALARQPTSPSAVPRTNAAFQLYAVSMLLPEQEANIHAAQGNLMKAMAPWDTGRKALNFLSGTTNTSIEAVRRAYDDESYQRLRELKTVYDPYNRFRVNHNIPPL